MAIGFGKTTQTTEQYIKNFLKHELKKVDPKILQDLWYADYSDRIYEYSIEDLLAKEWQELEVDENCSAFNMADSHKHLRPTLHAQLDIGL